MREFKIARDVTIIVACIFIVAHIWLLHPHRDIRQEKANQAIDQAMREMGN
jgi:hypothetical protein